MAKEEGGEVRHRLSSVSISDHRIKITGNWALNDFKNWNLFVWKSELLTFRNWWSSLQVSVCCHSFNLRRLRSSWTPFDIWLSRGNNRTSPGSKIHVSLHGTGFIACKYKEEQYKRKRKEKKGMTEKSSVQNDKLLL